jgi:hypothetical protein
MRIGEERQSSAATDACLKGIRKCSTLSFSFSKGFGTEGKGTIGNLGGLIGVRPLLCNTTSPVAEEKETSAFVGEIVEIREEEVEATEGDREGKIETIKGDVEEEKEGFVDESDTDEELGEIEGDKEG